LSILRSVALLAGLGLAGGLCAVQLTAAVFGDAAPSLAARLYPGGGASETALLAQKLNGLTPANAREAVAASRQLLTRAPLAEAPLAVAGQAFSVLHEKPAAVAVFTELLARSPRNPLARAWATDLALEEGRYEAAIRHADILMTLAPATQDAVIDLLVGLSRNSQSHDALRDVIARQPFWASAFVGKLVASSADAFFTYEIVQLVPKTQSFYLERLTGAGRFEEALIAWLGFLPKEDQNFSWPYDGAFQQKSGPTPFNWSTDGNATEFNKGGGLYASFRGRAGNNFLASQLIPLGAGAYRFEVVMDGELRPRGGTFRWSIRCMPSGTRIVELSITDLQEGRPKKFAAPFTRPAADCAVQLLAFEGVAGELPLWAKAQIRNVAIIAAPATAVPATPSNSPVHEGGAQ
jgi:tetratricopeptide (TPR) repeat protein